MYATALSVLIALHCLADISSNFFYLFIFFAFFHLSLPRSVQSVQSCHVNKSCILNGGN